MALMDIFPISRTGSYDEGIRLMSDECGCAYKTDIEREMGKISISAIRRKPLSPCHSFRFSWLAQKW
jgi:hypothetical protein